MSVELPEGAKEMWKEGRGSRLVVEFSGTSVMLRTNVFDPYSASSFQKKYGGEILREEHDAEHSALVVRGAARGPDGDGVEVLGWAPGLLCYGSDVPPKAIDAAFKVCSSMRRVGGIFTQGEMPEVHDEPVLAMKARSIETNQYSVQRVEEGELTCEQMLHELVLHNREDLVEIEERRGEHGPVRVWYAPREEGAETTKFEGFAVRGRYCCSFGTYPWLGEIPESDVTAMVSLCDRAGESGWPERFLPEPFQAGE